MLCALTKSKVSCGSVTVSAPPPPSWPGVTPFSFSQIEGEREAGEARVCPSGALARSAAKASLSPSRKSLPNAQRAQGALKASLSQVPGKYKVQFTRPGWFHRNSTFFMRGWLKSLVAKFRSDNSHETNRAQTSDRISFRFAMKIHRISRREGG